MYCIVVDIDECAEGTHRCHRYALCTNKDGGHVCQCQEGFTGNGTSCEGGCPAVAYLPMVSVLNQCLTCSDVNECGRDSEICHKKSDCLNVPGSYDCICGDGYSGDGRVNCSGRLPRNVVVALQTYVQCVVLCVFIHTDVDECELNHDNCHDNASCTNAVGGFNCSCMDGYRGDGLECHGMSLPNSAVRYCCIVDTLISLSVCISACPSMCPPACICLSIWPVFQSSCLSVFVSFVCFS